jgi:hypothetical protein
MTFKKITCCVCSLQKNINTSEYNRKIRLGTPFYCSSSCALVRNQNAKDALSNYANSTRNKEHLKRLRDNRLADPFAYFVKNARGRKSHECTVTSEYLRSIFELQQGLCAITRLPLELPLGTKGFRLKGLFNAASLDRIDSSKGYIINNVQFLCAGVNYMKSNWTDDYIRLWLNEISKSMEGHR